MRERSCLVELGDVVLRHVLLLIISGENCGPVLRAAVWPLAIQLSRIVNREKYFEKLSVGDLRRVKGYLDGLGVPCLAGAHHFVLGRGRGTSRISRSGSRYTMHVLENRLDAPETAARKNRSFFSGFRGQRRICSRIGEN